MLRHCGLFYYLNLMERDVIAEIKVINEYSFTSGVIELPKYQTEGSAAMDLQACIDDDLVLKAGESVLIGTGIAIHLGDANFVGMIYPRSGLGSKKGIVIGNGTGVIDSDYSGELKVCLWNRSDEDFKIERGMRIAQYMVVPVERINFKVVKDFTKNSERGGLGFGSTGF